MINIFKYTYQDEINEDPRNPDNIKEGYDESEDDDKRAGIVD